MPNESWVTVLACGVAILALAAALMAFRALRRLRREVRGLQERAGDLPHDVDRRLPAETPHATTAQHGTGEVVYAPVPLERTDGRARQVLPHEHAVVTQDGTVIVLPSGEQLVAATMGRPLVRGAVLSHGLMYALRPESRDRIRGIVRREFRRRRKLRRRAARMAARSVPVSHDDTGTTSWIGGSPPTTEQEGTR
ncbi:hypothetical protein KV100_18600 [Mumia sp. zg.B21]|uniref:hypothetical protein n=1 Tax=Mumia sp. zg.B21 TaxID=2855447 RepID=UPI001C6F1E24|nr:hypothetical protein [Mumia sp. zg.B21]MBW9211662.1 hypothetical protein [Mumia sp. zg.B21]